MDTTKENLIQNATILFANHGFKGASTRLIAKKAECNIALIKYHFGGKRGLFEACLTMAGKSTLSLVKNILEPPDSPEAFKVRLKLFIAEFLDKQRSNAHIHKILNKELSLEDPFFLKIVNSIYKDIILSLKHFFLESQDKGFVSKSIPAGELAGMLHGIIIHQVSIDPIRKMWADHSIHEPAFLKEVESNIYQLFTSGVVLTTH